MNRKEQITIFYQVGDHVAHPGHGGCTIHSVCERTFGGISQRYFVLVPETDPQTTILAPIENVDKIGLRRIISAEKADQLITYISSVEVGWVNDHARRKQAYEETLREGDLSMIAKMIKELTIRGMEANLNHCDKEMLPRAKKRLFSEIALAKGIDFEGAVSLASTALH